MSVATIGDGTATATAVADQSPATTDSGPLTGSRWTPRPSDVARDGVVFELVSHLPYRGIEVACNGRDPKPGDHEFMDHVGVDGLRRVFRAESSPQRRVSGGSQVGGSSTTPCARRKSTATGVWVSLTSCGVRVLLIRSVHTPRQGKGCSVLGDGCPAELFDEP